MTDVLTDPAVSAPAPRRRRRWIVGPAVATLVLGTVGFATYVRSYDALQEGSVTVHGEATRVLPAYGGNREVWVVPFAPGADQVQVFSVRNAGRWPITVDSVDVEDPASVWGIRSATGRAVIGSDAILRKQVSLPHRLEPGQELGLAMTYRMRPCGVGSAGTRYDLDDVPVRWHALGADHLTRLRGPIVSVQLPPQVPTRFSAPCP